MVHTGGPFGDECNTYTFTTNIEHYTIRDLIGAARLNTPEWGYIEVEYSGSVYKLEYRHGRIISNNIIEALYDKEFTEGTAYGGWSRMDYKVVIPSENYGGKRKGAGRPRKGKDLRQTLTFSVDPSIVEKAQRLRNAGFPLNIHIEALVEEKYTWFFNDPPIAGED